MPADFHRLARDGRTNELRALIGTVQIDGFDDAGYTALMHAAQSPKAAPGTMSLLLDAGANLNLKCRAQMHKDYTALAFALKASHTAKVRLLTDRGADVEYRRPEDYDALLDAAYGNYHGQNAEFVELLRLLIDAGCALNGISSHGECAIRVLAFSAQFEAVKFLLDAGADESLLKWTPLIRAVALGSLQDVTALVDAGAGLEDTDRWGKTAWQVAVRMGDLPKAQLLLARGAMTGAHPLIPAIESRQMPILRWLLEIGASVDEPDDYGNTPVMTAAQLGNAEGLAELIRAGANIHAEKSWSQTALNEAQTRDTAALLLAAGADPAHLSKEARRALVGLPADEDEGPLIDITPAQFLRGRARRFGASNPEEMQEPFWEAMIRAGTSAYHPAAWFGGRDRSCGEPVWCAQRFGQSLTILPDGRTVQIGGEHEDSYDPDFCIYNDVFVHAPDGSIRIFGYPESVFPPTDFHTATLIGGGEIFIIGSLGYHGSRLYGTTPVYRLDTETFRMTPVITTGEAPGWISRHRAVLQGEQEIVVTGGHLLTWDGNKEVYADHRRSFVLNTRKLTWRANS